MPVNGIMPINDPLSAAELRIRAEAELARRPPPLSSGESDVRRLQHELQVHQIELEMQNEALQQTNIDLLASCERYRDSALHFSQFMEHLPACAFIKDAQSRHIFVNTALARLGNTTAGALLGKTNADLWPQEIAAKLDSADAVVISSGSPLTVEEDVLMANGMRTYRTTRFPIRRSNGETFLAGVSFDVTERKQAEKDLSESEVRWRFALEGAGDGVWDWEIQTGVAFYSPRYKQMLGFSEDEIGATAEEWSKRIHPEDAARVMAALQPYLDGKSGTANVEFRMLCKDGSWQWTHGRGMVMSRDANGKALRMIGTNSDISERKQMEDQIRQLAFYDALTTLPNRRLLNDRLQQSMAANKRSGCFGALMFIDLDNFKPLNDVHGHEVGDLALVEAADRLKRCVREMDTVARFGGDEFVVLINELSADRAESAALVASVAEKIHGALAGLYVLTIERDRKPDLRIEYHCTASIGVALFADHQTSQDDIIKWADTAMYQAKKAGRNAIRFHE